MFTITRYHDFSAGHKVHGHESKCAHLHGHNYRVHFTVAAHALNGNEDTHTELDKIGRVIDFSVIKERLCKWLEETWDHKFLISLGDPLSTELKAMDYDGVALVAFNPTAENMASWLVLKVAPDLLAGTGVRLIRCTVEETRKCSATYEVEDA